ncbi:MAG: peptide deformylase [Bacteroidales bacterium]|jgi:peptide deformylase|nr:peptide deformylase [Bacteroidales bacterium]
MILPIVRYGQPILRQAAKPIDKEYANIKELVANMYETMYAAHGIGLAAPQIDIPIAVFVVDVDCLKENYPDAIGFKRTFINPELLEESGEEWYFNEGCLSVPDIHEDVKRKSIIKVRYFDENFVQHTETLTGICARVFQHEYDHLQGKVFIERLSPLRRSLLKRKLNDIADGHTTPDYKMKTVQYKHK